MWTYFSTETGSKSLVDTESADNPTNDYWSEARTPLSSLLFLLPWIAIYELGVIAIGQDQPDAVRIRLETQFGMLAESILLAIVLIAVGQCHDLLFRQINAAPHADALLSHAVGGSIGQAVSFIGAGVYEEVMFRLLLVPAAFLAFRMFEFPPKWAAVMSAVSTSFLFALAHHIGPSADAFNLFAFSFRAAAGLFFATVFLLRGFGITVGCHAAYDLFVGVLLVVPAE